MLRHSLVGCLAILSAALVSNLPKAMGGNHGAVLVASSKSQLADIGEALPTELLDQVSSFGQNAFGPILSAAKPDSPLGAWVDWSGRYPADRSICGIT